MSTIPSPPFLVFSDRNGGFLVFDQPLAVYAGPDLAAAEAHARSCAGWLAGGLAYARAESEAPGWWGVFASARTVSRADLDAWAVPGPVVTSDLHSLVSEDQYRRGFDEVRQALTQGHSYQVNLTFPLEGRAFSGGPWSWRAALRLWLQLIAEQGREASFAVLGTPGAPGPVLASASPELFFAQDGVVVEARPMKGTGQRHADPATDAASRHELATSAKTRAENLMITDMLRNDLGRLALAGGVTVPTLFEIEEYPTVWQMTSTVRAELPDLDFTTLLGALFPCASITGAPKLSTQDVIARAEPEPRGWYTGTLGWHRPAHPAWGPARSRFAVLIRTLVWSDASSTFRLGVGGGVVWDSTPQGEWEEAWAKSRFLAPTRRWGLTEAILWTPHEGFSLVPEHEARLVEACRAWGIPWNDGTLRRALDAWLDTDRPSTAQKVRAVVDAEGRLTLESRPLDDLPDVLTLALATEPWGPETLRWRQFKTTQRDLYETGRVEGADQTLHYNERGELTETTTMNLVVERQGRFFTPALDAGLLPGTFRARLIAEGKLEEAVLTKADLADADALWLINSVRGWKRARLVP